MRITKTELLEKLRNLPDEIEVVVNTEGESFPDVSNIRIMLLDDHGKLFETDEAYWLGPSGEPFSIVLAIEVS